MKKILHIISSPNGNRSKSIQLGNSIIEKLSSKYPGSDVTTVNLIEKNFPHLEESQIVSAYTPEPVRTPEQKEALKHSDEAVKQVMDSDIIVIGVPFYNFSIHSTLKAWIDHVVRVGVTFKMGENGFEGQIKGKKVYIALASGGIYSEGAMQEYDFATPYLKAVLGFIGITDVEVVRVEGTAIPGIKDTAMEKAVLSIAV